MLLGVLRRGVCLEGEKRVICIFSDHSDQCTQSSDNFFSNVSVNVERKAQPKMAAGSWQEWSGDTSLGEGVWNKMWDKFDGEKRSSSERQEVGN